MTAEVQTLIDTPTLAVWSSDGVELAVWQADAPGADPASHGYALLGEPEPFIDAGLVVAEVVYLEATAAGLRAWHEALAA